MSSRLQELQDYYSNLLIKQYHNKPKAKATIELFVSQIFSDDLAYKVQNAFDIETAVGKQLDVLGKYIGLNRDFNGISIPDSGFFGLADYDGPNPPTGIGLQNYDNVIAAVPTITYEDVVNTQQLNDEVYRIILKFRIVQNHSDHSHKTIDDSLHRFFENNIVASSNGNMKMYYFVHPSSSSIANIAAKKGVLPRPAGVGIDYLIESPGTPSGALPGPFFAFKRMGATVTSDLTTGFKRMGIAKAGRFLSRKNLTKLS